MIKEKLPIESILPRKYNTLWTIWLKMYLLCSVQPSQQISNLNFLCQRHDPITVKISNQTWIYFVDWLSSVFLQIYDHFLPISLGLHVNSPLDCLFNFRICKQFHQFLFVLRKHQVDYVKNPAYRKMKTTSKLPLSNILRL